MHSQWTLLSPEHYSTYHQCDMQDWPWKNQIAWKTASLISKMYYELRCNGLEFCYRRISCFHAFWCFSRPILAIFHIANVFLSGFKIQMDYEYTHPPYIDISIHTVLVPGTSSIYWYCEVTKMYCSRLCTDMSIILEFHWRLQNILSACMCPIISIKSLHCASWNVSFRDSDAFWTVYIMFPSETVMPSEQYIYI